ncbi:hypothetical protein PR048_030023 [Dryococelus australis]|uniref:Peptidase aspartic putative domain-containing protein n=1 Tax=Dryococelus australis TaxID=614101 RepID=A0ABQ9G7S6_9NEOP|nr:hypothetical protein PR048_030023 [Dryococelus australis]
MFENKRVLASRRVSALFNLPQVERESATRLRQLLDNVLNQPIESWDTLLIHLITSKLDNTTIREWETTAPITILPTLTELTMVLLQRCHILELRGPNIVTRRYYPSTVSYVTSHNVKCKIRDQMHFLYQCDTFRQMLTVAHIRTVKEFGMCFNCLRSSHELNHCTSGMCKYCNKNTIHCDTLKVHQLQQYTCKNSYHRNHRRLVLHIHNMKKQAPNSIERNVHILLSTAVVNSQYSQCCCITIRVRLDAGSQTNFIAEHTVQMLGLEMQRISSSVSGICTSKSKVNYCVSCNTQSRLNSYACSLNYHVLPTITHKLPMVETQGFTRLAELTCFWVQKYSSIFCALVNSNLLKMHQHDRKPLLIRLHLDRSPYLTLPLEHMPSYKYRTPDTWKHALPNLTYHLKKYYAKQITQRLVDEISKDVT